MSLTRSLMWISLATAAACAGNRPRTSSGPARWTGNLRETGGSTTAVIGHTTNSQSSAYGSISVTPVDSEPPISRVELTVNTPSMAGNQLAWGIFTGPCGSPSPLVAGINEFPSIEMTTAGGRLGMDLHFRLIPGTEYHANVYMGNHITDASNVLVCGNLSLSR